MKSSRQFIVTLILCVLLFAGAAPPTQAFDWPGWRGPDGDGMSKETDWNPQALAGGPRVLWTADIGSGYSNVAVSADRVYTFGCDPFAAVKCLRAEDGEVIWEYTLESRSPGAYATPTVSGGSVYALSKDGILLCLNARNGKLRWKKDIAKEYGAVEPTYGFGGSPVVAGDLVLLTANTSGMAVDRRRGRLVWSSEPPDMTRIEVVGPYSSTGTEYLTPVLYEQGGRRLALVSSAGGLSAVEAATGKPVWRFPWERYGGGQGGDPVVVGSRVLVTFDLTHGSDAAQSVLLESGGGQPQVVWRSPHLFSQFGNSLVIDGYVYGAHGGPVYYTASLRCLELEHRQAGLGAAPRGNENAPGVADRGRRLPDRTERAGDADRRRGDPCRVQGDLPLRCLGRGEDEEAVLDARRCCATGGSSAATWGAS